MRTAFLIAFLLVFAAPASGFADDLEQFEQHLEAGVAAIDAGDYETALYELELAREFHDHPLLRYHVARAHEALGECSAAKVQYRVVASDGDAPDEVRDAANDALDTIDEWCEPKGATARPASTDGEVSAAPAEPERGQKTWRVVGWSAAGVGTAIVGATLVKIAALDRPNVRRWRDFFSDSYGCSLAEDNTLDTSECRPRDQAGSDYDKFRSDLAAANRSNTAGLVTGGVIVAAGVTTLVVVGLTKEESAVSASVSPSPNGVQLFVRF